jgi:hypothetical protein
MKLEKLFEQIYYECRLIPIFEKVFREALYTVDNQSKIPRFKKVTKIAQTGKTFSPDLKNKPENQENPNNKQNPGKTPHPEQEKQNYYRDPNLGKNVDLSI